MSRVLYKGSGRRSVPGKDGRQSDPDRKCQQLSRIDNEQAIWLPVSSFTATSLATQLLAGLPPGTPCLEYFLTVYPLVHAPLCQRAPSA